MKLQSPRRQAPIHEDAPVGLLAEAVLLKAVEDARDLGKPRPRWMSKQEYLSQEALRLDAVEFLAGGPDLAFWLDLVGLPPDWAPLVRLREELGG